MRIESVESLLIDRYFFVRITAEDGTVGIGEGGAWGFQEATAGAVIRFRDYLLGKDPLQIEHHWQYMYRWAHFRGSAVMAAISAIDIALWDIAGKRFGVPVHQLLGGKIRNRARCYYHVFGETKEELFSGIERAKSLGFTAVGHLTPFLDTPRQEPYYQSHAELIGDAIDTVRQYRDIAGREVDLCIEIHRRLKPYEAVQLGRGIEDFHPLFIEDPVTPDNLDEMSYVAGKIAIPVATGERLTSLWEFQMLLARNAVQLVRPDVCIVGGISGARKIAVLAEASHAGVVPHNPLSAVSTAACLQIAATAPTFVVQEFPNDTWNVTEQRPETDLLFEGAARHDGEGFLKISDTPGIGIALRDDAEQKFPYRPLGLVTRLHKDGSVVDQ
ncbi:mandelate racemase/muconate lactonizing enzyme family protein [Salipiger marinus]|uniref:mandelate racemase/muconate lactonizing enzyme family protein n=1 Tax=Salipiger marinus TaxID=555512 RepID=UPI002BAB83AC|nr:mandelate racemase/muconate lactonizing enzyme family protein [Salipiger manganoxidans]MEB3419294.1 mandelate racemase/muconate lactonizing enzyme family protein [Salipiger manganoxidans]